MRPILKPHSHAARPPEIPVDHVSPVDDDEDDFDEDEEFELEEEHHQNTSFKYLLAGGIAGASKFE